MDFKAAFLGLTLIGFCAVSGAVVGDDDNNANHIARGLDAKGLFTSLAGNLMSRGYATSGTGGSQVVSLNLTNLLVLILLKALIFAAGSLGAGHWKGGFGRNLDGEEQLLSDEEILLFLSYLTGAPGDNGCLQSVACQQPEQAKKYLAAGDMLLKTVKMLSMNPDLSYQYVLQEMEQAIDIGANGGDCSRFVCNTEKQQ